ncbi:MAG TPA: HNH endonuclease signature motif containing protein [Longimicrobiales bacterium]|nr:HNH endonuclease signature motif containing protein [Longimicrobiales bacterium]
MRAAEEQSMGEEQSTGPGDGRRASGSTAEPVGDMGVAQHRISAETSPADMGVAQGRISAETSPADMGAVPMEPPAGAGAGALPQPERAALRCELSDGTRLSAESARRLCCDIGVVRVRRAPDGAVLDVGRKTRSIPPALRRALEVRDRGCRFPGCGRGFTDGHHVEHWVDGGATSLANCLLLCRFHHRLVHEGGWRVQWWGEGRPVFIGPAGQERFEGGWTPPALPERPVEALVRANRRAGADPDAFTAGARWRREEDIPDAVLFGAMEAAG